MKLCATKFYYLKRKKKSLFSLQCKVDPKLQEIMSILVPHQYLGIPVKMEEHFAVKHNKQQNSC